MGNRKDILSILITDGSFFSPGHYYCKDKVHVTGDVIINAHFNLINM